MAYYYGVWPLREAPPKGVGQGPIEVNKMTIAYNLNRATCHDWKRPKVASSATESPGAKSPRPVQSIAAIESIQAARLEVIVHTELAGVHAFGVMIPAKVRHRCARGAQTRRFQRILR